MFHVMFYTSCTGSIKDSRYTMRVASDIKLHQELSSILQNQNAA